MDRGDVLTPAEKIGLLQSKLRALVGQRGGSGSGGGEGGDSPVVVSVRRGDSLVSDLLIGFARMAPRDVLLRRVCVQFGGEEGVDAGGLLKVSSGSLIQPSFSPHLALI